MEEAKIKEFAADFDPQPFHLDASAAQSSVFKGLAASGWHTAAIAMRLLVSGGLPLANGIVGLGVEITWPRPTRPGDILRVEREIVDITPSRSKSNQAVVAARSTMLNQNDQPVYVLNAKLLVFYWFSESLGVALQGLATGTGGGTSPVTHFRARHGFENRTR
jgi:acyl dehydratase